jgi:serine/threonine protein kinase
MTTLEPGPDFTINNRWVIGVKIASGGFGAIYKGVDLKTKEDVAIKVVSHSSHCLRFLNLMNHIRICWLISVTLGKSQREKLSRERGSNVHGPF